MAFNSRVFLSLSLKSSSEVTVLPEFGKLISKSISGCNNSPFNLMTTSTGIFRFTEGFSKRIEGLAWVVYLAFKSNNARSGLPSQRIFPKGSTSNCLETPYLKSNFPS